MCFLGSLQEAYEYDHVESILLGVVMLPVTQLIDLSNQLVRCCLISILIKISLQKKTPLYQIYNIQYQLGHRPQSDPQVKH